MFRTGHAALQHVVQYMQPAGTPQLTDASRAVPVVGWPADCAPRTFQLLPDVVLQQLSDLAVNLYCKL